MKAINSRKALNFAMLLLISSIFVVGCGKDPLPKNPVNTDLPAAPTVLTAKADTALYGGSANISVTTDGQTLYMGGVSVSGKTITLSNLTKDTLVTITAKNSNENGSTSKSLDFTVKVFDPQSSQLHLLNTVKNTVARACPAGTENSANPAWFYGTPDCNFYWFHANGTTTGSIGACNPNPGTLTAGVWKWKSADRTAIIFSGFDEWNITLLPNGFKRWRIEGNLYYEQLFIKQ
jgi:hypothetical protein